MTYNPDTNGKVERGHSPIVKALAKACDGKRKGTSSQLAHTGGCAGLVGVNVMWFFTHDMKTSKIIT